MYQNRLCKNDVQPPKNNNFLHIFDKKHLKKIKCNIPVTIIITENFKEFNT